MLYIGYSLYSTISKISDSLDMPKSHDSVISCLMFTSNVYKGK